MAQIKLLGKTNIQGKTIFETAPNLGFSVSDANAQAYITAVETADGASLETPVKQAIENFIVGCKSDGIWNAIKASCILTGARTLNGALVPLVGTAPTNNNFVSADYNRKTGLKGDASTKYLSTNRNNNADPQNNHHFSLYVTSHASVTSTYISAGTGNSGASQIVKILNNQYSVRNRNSTDDRQNINNNRLGFVGTSRANSSNHTWRNGSNVVVSRVSQTPANLVFLLYRNTGTTGLAYSDSRLSFYSIGESLDLALLDTRVSALMTAINAAI